MSARRQYRDDPETLPPQSASADHGPLFAATADDLGREGLTRSAEAHGPRIAVLVPLALELAAKAGQLTVSDLRITAVQRGLLTGQERGKELSYLPAVMKAAGLTPTGQYIRSPIPRTHGNLQMLWRAA